MTQNQHIRKITLNQQITFIFQARARVAVLVLLTFAIAYNIPRFFEITWEPISYEEATKRLDFDAELQPGENISSYKPTDMRINGQYIRLIFFPNDTIESFATIFSHCCCSSIL